MKTYHIINHNENVRFSEGKSALLFNHIPKCAGSTLLNILQKRFKNNYFFAQPPQSWITLKEDLNRTTSNEIAIAGHSAWGMHERLNHSYKIYYTTILRNPFERFLSEYRLMRSLYSHVRSPEEYLNTIPHHNYMVQWLGNGSLNLAIDRLSSIYFCFGILEKFDDYLAVLSSEINIKVKQYERKNATKADQPETTEIIRDEFEEKNQLDIELYEWAASELSLRRKKDSRDKITISNNAVSFSGSIGPTTFYTNFSMSTKTRQLLDNYQYRDAANIIEDENTDLVWVCIHRAELFEKINRMDKAEYWYKRAAVGNVSRNIDLADFYYRNFMPAKSIAILKKTINSFNVSTDFPDSMLNQFQQNAIIRLAEYYGAMGRNNKALNLFNKAININPLSWTATSALSTFHAHNGNMRQALRSIKHIIRNPPQHNCTLHNVATHILSLYPINTSLITRLIKLYIRTQWAKLTTERSITEIAVFGAGAHTEWLQNVTTGFVGPHVAAVLDDNPNKKKTFWKHDISNAVSWNTANIDAIVLSTDTLTDKMRNRCRELYGNDLLIIDLYYGLPPGPYPKEPVS